MSTIDPFADGAMVDRLRALHEHYVDAINRAVADGRDDLVAELAADYPDEALAVMAGRPVRVGEGPDVPLLRLARPVAWRPRSRVRRWAAAFRATFH